MHVIFVHYHLNRGGVTRVIENLLRALASLSDDKLPHRLTIAYGGRAAAWGHHIAKNLPFDVKLTEIPQLDYDTESSQVTGQLQQTLTNLLTETDCAINSTVLHVHNHSLGKNVELPLALARLANDGWYLLLHIHDFAEDLRPSNYQHMLKHAESPDQLHRQLYACSADSLRHAEPPRLRYLEAPGMHADRLHLLTNAVAPLHQSVSTERAEIVKKNSPKSMANSALALMFSIRFERYGERT